jgi:hypothetical protein
MVNSVARVGNTLLQAIGRPDITAKIHLAELPFYLVMLSVAAVRWGAMGAAFVWTLRMIVDGFAFLGIAGRLLRSLRDVASLLVVMVAVCLAAIALALLPQEATVRIGLLIGVLLFAGGGLWGWFLEADDRALLLSVVRRSSHRVAA